MIHSDVAATVGRTPLVELGRLRRSLELRARLAGKLESHNPCGSIKDRLGVALIEDAERRGLLKPGATIVESTSGNTGIALAFLAAARGYKLVVTMPERMSRERAALLGYLGAKVVLTPGSLMRDAVAKAEALALELPGAVQLHQFENPANPEIHRRTTAPEIWKDTEGEIEVFVAGVGTGGTITGVGEYLKGKKPTLRVVAVEPQAAAVLSGKKPRNHLIQGIGAGFVPPILNRQVIDEVVMVSEDEAFDFARRLAREEGISAGISSGATLAAACQIARRPEYEGKLVVVMIGDSGERYVNTPLMQELAGRSQPDL
jgi:cysteine synthase A